MVLLLIKQLIMEGIKIFITKALCFIFTLFLISCSRNMSLEKEMAENQKLANYFANHIDSISKKNNVKYGHIIVNIDTTHKLKKPIIFYDPLIYPNENLVKEYTLYLIRSIDSTIINKIDSVIFEIQTQDTTFGLKRYRGSKEEIFNLKESYKPYGRYFDSLIEFIVKNNYAEAISFIDDLMKETNEKNFNGKINWLNQSFLDYTKQIYLYKDDTIQSNIDKRILNDFFYPMPMWYEKKDVFNIFNFVRKQLKMEELIFTLDDTLKYGTKPHWLIDMYHPKLPHEKNK